MKNKRIFIEIPTWLGDAVMTTPAIENIINTYPDCELIILGSFVSSKIFANHPNVKKVFVDNSKKSGFRYINLYKIAKNIGRVDIAFSFRKNFTSDFLLFYIDSTEKYRYQRYTKDEIHLVIRYNDFINRSLKINTTPKKLKIYGYEKKENNKKILGINPGATYGSAKRWYPEEFAKVIVELSEEYETLIFGGSDEIDMAKNIEDKLISSNIINYQNLAGRTTVEELMQNIANLDLFITNDSGPMHLAAAFGIPSVCIFGPTKFTETSQWQNQQNSIVKKDFSCMPCMKRECPLIGDNYHQCMKNIKSIDVIMSLRKWRNN